MYLFLLFQLISTAVETDIGEAVKKSESFEEDQVMISA